ncbi:hypothetical protein ACFL2U_00625 [Patescibacteria group bacterium]
MNELNFNLKGQLGEVEATMKKICTLAERFSCTFQLSQLSTEGKNFKVVGSKKNLLRLQSALTIKNLPTGLLLLEQAKTPLCKIHPIKKRP